MQVKNRLVRKNFSRLLIPLKPKTPGYYDYYLNKTVFPVPIKCFIDMKLKPIHNLFKTLFYE